MLRSDTRTGADAAEKTAARPRKENAVPVLRVARVVPAPHYWLLLLHKGQVAMYYCTRYFNDAEGLAGFTAALIKTAQNNLK
ncbi:MAG: hypothetical protein ICV83_09425 [Cytophagales bacterium]|nr:hypothetical protein [Cytophagales bacterium]